MGRPVSRTWEQITMRKPLSLASIKGRFAITISIISIIGMGGLFIWNGQSTKTALQAEQESHIIELTNRLKTSLPTSLWEYNAEQLKQTVNAELPLPFVLGIQVNDLNGVYYSAFRGVEKIDNLQDQVEQSRQTSKVEFNILYQSVGEKHLIGSATIFITNYAVEEALLADIYNRALQFLVLLVAIVFVQLIVLYLIVLKPLMSVQIAFAAITESSANLSTRLPINPTVEFKDITLGFNRFVGKVQRVLGGSIDEVHASIKGVAEGDLYGKIAVSPDDGESIMFRLAVMQKSLRDFSENEKNTELLIAAKEAADIATQAKSDFISNINHEIRNPLAAIIGVTDLLFATRLDEEQHALANMLRRSGGNLHRLVNEVLDFSKLEEHFMVLETTSFQMETVVSDAINVAQDGRKPKNIAIFYTIDDAANAQFIGDSMRIGQILINFLNNALKFTREGSIHIRVGFTPQSISNGTLKISVKDTGIGIEASQLNGLFERFSQADASITRRYGGTGLGLAICKRLAELMDGTVGAESVVGVGSEFCCELHVELDTAPSECLMQDTPRTQNQRELGASEYKPHVLIVDDVIENQMIISKMLKNENVHSSVAVDGAIAIKMVFEANNDGNPFDLVLMDLHMKNVDGITAARQILSADENRKLPVIAMTADARSEMKDLALEVGFIEFLSKPFRQRTLKALIDKYARPDQFDM